MWADGGRKPARNVWPPPGWREAREPGGSARQDRWRSGPAAPFAFRTGGAFTCIKLRTSELRRPGVPLLSRPQTQPVSRPGHREPPAAVNARRPPPACGGRCPPAPSPRLVSSAPAGGAGVRGGAAGRAGCPRWRRGRGGGSGIMSHGYGLCLPRGLRSPGPGGLRTLVQRFRGVGLAASAVLSAVWQVFAAFLSCVLKQQRQSPLNLTSLQEFVTKLVLCIL